MPLFDVICPKHGLRETFLFSTEIDNPPACGLYGCTEQLKRLPAAPALLGTESKTAMIDERIYRTHNATRTETQTRGDGGTVTRTPVSPADQCQCGNCGAHRRRAPITGTAAPGKEV